MQTSGPISIGQAENECQIGGQVDAANGTLSQLAGVGSGQTYAWSYWYGKSHLTPINNVLFASASVHVDRDLFLYVNLRTGATSWNANGNNNPTLNWFTQQYPSVSQAALYKSWNASIVFQAGSTGVILTISQQPSPANDYTACMHFDDNGPSGAHDVQAGLYITFGQ
jgi:hypothetical protein